MNAREDWRDAAAGLPLDQDPREISNIEIVSYGPVLDPPHPDWAIQSVERTEMEPPT